MPNPSLHFYYRGFIITTIWSAAIASPQPYGVCFPIPVLHNDNDFTCSNVPPNQYSSQLNPGSNTANNLVTAVLCLECKRNHSIFTPSCPFEASSLVHSRSALLVTTARYISSLLNSSLTTTSFPLQQHEPF